MKNKFMNQANTLAESAIDTIKRIVKQYGVKGVVNVEDELLNELTIIYTSVSGDYNNDEAVLTHVSIEQDLLWFRIHTDPGYAKSVVGLDRFNLQSIMVVADELIDFYELLPEDGLPTTYGITAFKDGDSSNDMRQYKHLFLNRDEAYEYADKHYPGWLWIDHVPHKKI